MINWRKFPIYGAPLLALVAAEPALAQTSQSPMPMGWEMTWGMVFICALVVLVLVLAAAALVKYLFFR